MKFTQIIKINCAYASPFKTPVTMLKKAVHSSEELSYFIKHDYSGDSFLGETIC